MNRVKYTLLIVCMMVWGSAVFPLAALQAGDTIAGITGVESLSSREIQEIVAILAAEPGIEPVKDGKRRLRELISGFNDKIAAAEKEINQLRTALEGIDREESKGQPVMNQALAGLISLKQQKELELVHWRLLSLTAEEAFQKLDQYLQRQASRDNHYRAAPFWEVFSDMVRGSAVDEQIDDQPRPGGTLFIMAVAATFFFSLSLFPGVRSFVEKNGNAGNGVHILFGRLSRLTPVIRWTMGVAVFSVLALNLALPVFPDRYNLAAAILTIFFFFVIRLLLQVVILRFKPAVAGV